MTATSDVTVNVEQVLTSIAVSPAMATLAAGDSRKFAAQADDQFGNLVPLPGPVYTWSSPAVSARSTPSPVSTQPQAKRARPRSRRRSVASSARPASPSLRPTNGRAVRDNPLHCSAYWRTGFVGDVMITNTGSTAIDGWTLQFNFAPKITSIWGAAIASTPAINITIDNVQRRRDDRARAEYQLWIRGQTGTCPGGTEQHQSQRRARSALTMAGPAECEGDVYRNQSVEERLCATVTIANMGTVPIGGWALQFNFKPRITSITNAAIVRHTGPVYVIRDAGYDGVISPGGSVSFQLRGSQRRLRSGPVKYRLDGVPIGGGISWTTPPERR